MKADQLPEQIDLGDGHSLRFFTIDGVNVIGATEEHPSATDTSIHKVGEMCAGAVYFDVPELPSGWQGVHKWTVESWEPLTISPSVLCTLCENHGFIREGKWVPA